MFSKKIFLWSIFLIAFVVFLSPYLTAQEDTASLARQIEKLKAEIERLQEKLQTTSTDANQEPSYPSSHDGKYKAEYIEKNGTHFQIIEKETGKILFKTYAKYTTPNDVKSGGFVVIKGKLLFIACYHYSHSYSSWFGIWSVPTGKLQGFREMRDYISFLDPVYELLINGK